ncbi:MAG: protein-glutamate O-methyltransferase CheR [Bacteriovoracaceae bacterium]
MPRDQILTFFSKYIESELGMVYSENNDFQLQNRLEEIVKLHNFANIQELYEVAQKGMIGSLKQLVLDVATNNETSFFRDTKYFNAFRNLIEQQMKGDLFPQKELKIWSAASSTGQEALSISILIDELKKKHNSSLPYSILGTDISERALTKAREAKYRQLEVQRGLTTAQMIQYFTKDDKDMWEASKELTKHIQFKKMNLRDDNYPYNGFHFIFCRNVLIYQSVENKIKILNKLESCLVPGGFLILGVGESLIGLDQDYETVMMDNAVIYRKKHQILKVA